MKKVRSSLNLDLDLSLHCGAYPAWCSPVVLDVRTSKVLACHNSFSTVF
jgi:hypothetical protein